MEPELIKLLRYPPKCDFHILINAGHGWDTKGKESPDFDGDGHADIKENHANQSWMRKMTFMFDLLGWDYTILVTGHEDVPLRKRSKRERDLNKQHGSTMLLELHFNGFKTEDANGVEIFHWTGDRESKLLADLLMDRYRSLDINIRKVRASRKGHWTNFHMLRETKSIPRVLIEGGFMTNREDAKKIKSDRWLNDLSARTIMGIADYLKSKNDQKVEEILDSPVIPVMEPPAPVLNESLPVRKWFDWILRILKSLKII